MNEQKNAVETKLDSLIASFEDHRGEMRHRLDRQESRVSALEQWKSRASGIYIGASTVLGYLLAMVLK